MLDKYKASSNIFLNVLKNFENDSSRHISTNEKDIESKFKNPIEYIEKLSTYEKVQILQRLLKEMKSIKERFEENINIMLERLKNNCKDYYKNQIGMKAIYDYCKSNNPEKYYNYVLVEKNEERFGQKNYEIINKIIFLIRNNNDLLLELIENCPPNSFEQFADFLVNFLFNNTIDSSFNEEELIIIIYLIIEKNILYVDEATKKIKDEKSIYSKKGFIHYLFKYLTRKPDLRSFTHSILSKYIIQFEEYNDSLSLETKTIENINIRRKSINMLKNELNNRYNSFSYNSENSPDLNEISKKLTYSNILNATGKNIEEILDDSDEDSELQIDDINENIEIAQFFKDENVTLEFLKSKLSKYEQNKININEAMKTYINNNINELNKAKSEIFSNNVKISLIKKYQSLNKEDDNLIETIKKNYKIITKYIDDIINTLKENILSLPYIIKSINIILLILIKEKYSKEKKENVEYNSLLFLSNFFIGNIIIPLLSNPYFNGIITKGVLSKVSKDNLEIISKILTQMISGNLFSNEKAPEYTIFNKYIINTLPNIFQIINKLNSQKNFKLLNPIKNLMNSYGKPQRNLNYNFFEENQENIQQKSICFSWLDLIILIDMIKASKGLDKIEVYQKNKEIFDQFLNMKAYFYDEYNGNNIELQTDYFVFEQIIYSPYLNKQIQSLLQESYYNISTNKEDETIFFFKKFFVEVLTFINKINNNNYISSYTQEPFLNNDYNKISQINRTLRYNKYLEIFSEEEIKNQNLESILEKKELVEIDFKNTIFPNIIETIKNELAHNIDTITAKRIAFYASYLEIHIKDLDEKYKESNYSLFIMEILKKYESIINKINSVIINQYYIKIKDGIKLNMIIKNNFLQTKKMEKCICIKYLFDKLILPCKLNIVKDDSNKISKITYEKLINQSRNYIYNIQSFIDNFPDFRKIAENEEDIIDFEENIELDSALNAYFQDIKNLLKNETIMERYSKEEFETVQFELENYILYKLYAKLFPSKPTKKDIRFYNKCCRLSFIKPESLIKDKKAINEKLWEASIVLINELDNKFTPFDKVEKFGKAFGILQNSLTFSSGKNDLGIDDTISILIYVMLKAKPKNIFSNSKFCQLFLNPTLSKKIYGILMSQIEMIKNIIYNMKYTDLIGVTEEEFGKDDEE